MSVIDERVVQMVFKNDQFERGIQQSLSSLNKLKSALHLDGAAKGLENIDKASQNLDLSGIAAGVESLEKRFSTMGIVGMRVIQNLTDASLRMAKKISGFLTGGIVQGGINRAMNIEQAKFQLEGLGIAYEDIEADINYAVKKTAYGLDAAATAASQLVASGVEFGKKFGTTGNSPMAKALRGISGVAAMTNSSYEDISRIFTTVAGNGRLMGDQLNQLGGRGLNAAAVLAEAFHVSEKELREMVSRGEVSFQEFADAMDNAFGAHAKEANRTFTGSISNMKAALARIGADFVTPIIKMDSSVVKLINGFTDKIDEIHKLTTPLAEKIGKKISSIADSIYEVISSVSLLEAKSSFLSPLQQFIDLSKEGFKSLNKIISTIFTTLFDAFAKIDPSYIRNAFSAIFLLGRKLVDSNKNLDSFKSALESVFSIITKIGNALFRGISRFLVQLHGADKIANIIKGFLAPLKLITPILEKIGDFFSRFNGEAESSFPILFGILNFLEKIATVISNMTDKLLNKNPVQSIKKVSSGVLKDINALEVYAKTLEKISSLMVGTPDKVKAWFDKAAPTFDAIGDKIKTLSDRVKEFASIIGDKLKKAFGSIDIKSISSVLMAVLAGFSVKGLSNILRIIEHPMLLFEKSLSEGKISALITSLTTAFKNFQNTLKAKTLKELALAIGILAASMFVMSTIDPKNMMVGLGGLTAVIANLMGALVIFSKLSLNKNTMKTVAQIETLFISIAGAVFILAAAVKVLSMIDTKDLIKGLLALTVLFSEIAIFIRAISGNTKGILKASIAIAILGVAILVLTSAVAILGHMDLVVLGKGLGSIAVALGVLIAALALMPSKLVGAAAILVLAVALDILIPSIAALGSMDLINLAKGLGSIAVALGLLVAACALAKGAIFGATAILIIAAALTILVPVLITLGAMKFKTLAKGLGMFAAAIAALVGLAFLVSIFAAELLIFAGVLIAVSLAVVLFGSGVLALAAGLQIISTLGSAAADAISLLLLAVINLIPQFAASIAEGITIFIETLASSAGRIAQAVLSILVTIINTLADNAEQLIEAGFNLLISLVEGILKGLWKVAQAAWEAIKEFVNGLFHDPESVYTAGQKVMNTALEGLKEKLGDWYDIGIGCLRGFLGGLGNSRAIGDIATAAANAGSAAYDAAKAALEERSPSKKFKELGMYADAGLALGLRQFSNLPEKAAKSMALSVIDTISNDMDSFGLSPRITPILDTTNIEKNAGKINALLDSKRSISVGSLTTSGISTDSLSQTMFNFKMIEALSNLRSILAGNTQPSYSVYINGDYNNDEGVRGITKDYLEELIQYSKM